MKHSEKILVLLGGTSNEAGISKQSGEHVVVELQKAGFTVIQADPGDPGFNLKKLANDVDLVMPMLHGAGGEDGTLQSKLEDMGVRFVGSTSTACKLSYDKMQCKELLAEHGILTPTWQVIDHEGFKTSGLRESSYVLKPISGGSSIDTVMVHNPDHQFVDEAYISSLFKAYDKMLVEELIEGQEVTVAVFRDSALPVVQIIPPEGQEFDFENKYNGKTIEIPNPPGISFEKQQEAQDIALKVHVAVGCRDISRTDMIIAENGAIYVLEINTLPGMTQNSLYPKAVRAAGMEMPDFLKQLVVDGVSR